ncbi:MAG: EF-P lysine aminoacylase GenX [Myxococcales bacterium]|nr:EF-P lysine aminoacylase GenX [Myxococcales bacterium]
MIDTEFLLPRRHRFIQTVREWFNERDFIEVETPIAVTSPGMEIHLDAFSVASRFAGKRYETLYLHTSPEYHMKRALSSYSGPIYQLCHCFRDEPESILHRPEFIMLEWYRREADYRVIMDDVDGLLGRLGEFLLDEPTLQRPNGSSVDLATGSERISVREAMIRWANVDPWEHPSATELAAAAVREGVHAESDWPWEDTFHLLLLERVESQLGRGRPTLLFDYPRSLAALARTRDDVAERFELYVDGVELGNAFSELTDPTEQRARFQAEQLHRGSISKPVYPIDESLISALTHLPPSAGIAVGIDRLWLLFAEHWLGRPLTLSEVTLLSL